MATDASFATDQPIRLSLINGFKIDHAGTQTYRLRTRKTEAIVAYLALHSRNVARDELCNQFWPEESLAAARGKLRLALHSIRTKFGTHLLTEADTVRLHGVHVDVLHDHPLPAEFRLLPGYDADWLDDATAIAQARDRVRLLAAQSSAPESSEASLRYLIESCPTEPDAYKRLFDLYRQRNRPLAARLVATLARNVLGEDCPPGLSVDQSVRVRSDFIGRTPELARLAAILLGDDEPATVLLTGIGGVGKTRLAEELARIAPEADIPSVWITVSTGQTFTKLQEEVQHGLQTVLAIPPEEAADPSLIPSVLLILDNAESSPGAVAEVLARHCEPGCGVRVLVTSQVPLTDSPASCVTQSITLRALTLPAEASEEATDRSEAFRLLVQLSGAEVTAETRVAFVELTRISGGIPLAIRMLARALDLTTPETLVRVAQSSSTSLRFRGSHESHRPAHVSMEACLHASFVHLPPRSAESAKILATIPGRFEPDGAAILGISEECYSALLQQGWIAMDSQIGADFPPPVRTYLNSCQGASRVSQYVEILQNWLDDEITHHYPLNFSRVKRLAETYRDLLLQPQERVSASRLIARYFLADRTGELSTVAAALEKYVDSEDDPSPALVNLAGSARLRLRQYERATDHFTRLNHHPDPENRGIAIANLGLIRLEQGLGPEALEYLAKAVDLTTLPRRRASRILNLGSGYVQCGQFEEADRCFSEAMESFNDDPQLVGFRALAFHRRAEVRWLQRRPEDALADVLISLNFYDQSQEWQHHEECLGLAFVLGADPRLRGQILPASHLTRWQAFLRRPANLSTRLAYAALFLKDGGCEAECLACAEGVQTQDIPPVLRTAAKLRELTFHSTTRRTQSEWLGLATQAIRTAARSLNPTG